jgi:hypothetical protein
MQGNMHSPARNSSNSTQQTYLRQAMGRKGAPLPGSFLDGQSLNRNPFEKISDWQTIGEKIPKDKYKRQRKSFGTGG